MKILLATDVDFWGENRGSRVRIATLIRALGEAGLDLHVFYTGCNYQQERLKEVQEAYGLASVQSMPHAPKPLPGKLERWLQRQATKYYGFDRILNGPEPGLGDFRDKRVLEEFRSACERIRPGAVIIEFIRLSYLLEAVDGAALKILDTHDVMWRRYERHREAKKRHWIRISREEEAECLRRFDLVMAIQEEEAKIMGEMAGETTKVVTVGHPVMVSVPKERSEGLLRLGFIGANSNANQDAAEWFYHKVYSQLEQTCAWVIAGPVYNRLSGKIPESFLIGQVEYVERFYEQIDVLVNPVHFGGGLKIKNVESLGFGCPVLTTSLGAEGIEAGEDDGLFVVDEAGDYALILERLAGDRDYYHACSRAAVRFAERHFNPQAVCAPLIRELQDA